jgi:hypothetical protein
MVDDMVPTLLTVKQFSARHPAFPELTLRDMIFKSGSHPEKGITPNGMAFALMRNGRRVLIDETKFFQWLQEKQVNRAA